MAEFSGAIPLGEQVRKVRFEVRNGTVGVDVSEGREITYAGGARRAADSAEGLATIEAVELTCTAEPDPTDPSILVVRAPAVPEGVTGILALEIGIRLPADLELEISVPENGHITAANRTAALQAFTGRGDLRFVRCHCSIRASTGRGQVIVDRHRGSLDIQASVGSMQIFVSEPGDMIRLDSGEGVLQCYIPPDTGFEVDARAVTGQIGSSFGLAVEKPSTFSAKMTGVHGDGHTKIVMRVGKGRLTLGSKVFDE